LDVHAVGSPIGEAVLEARGLESVGAEPLDGLDREQAIGAATIGHDFLVGGDLAEAAFELFQRNRAGAGNVSRLVLFDGTHVEHYHLTALDAFEKRSSVDGLHRLSVFDVVAGNAFDLREPRLREEPKGPKEIRHPIVGKPVGDEEAALLGFDQSSGAKNLEVPGSVGDGLVRLPREGFDGARRLGKHVEKLKAARACGRLAEPRKLLINRVFERPVGFHTIQLFN